MGREKSRGKPTTAGVDEAVVKDSELKNHFDNDDDDEDDGLGDGSKFEKFDEKALAAENWEDCLSASGDMISRLRIHKLQQLGKGVGVFSKDGKSLFWTWAESPQHVLAPNDVRHRGYVGQYSTETGALIRILINSDTQPPAAAGECNGSSQSKVAASAPRGLDHPAVISLSLNPDNPLQLVTVSRNGVVRLWDTTDGTLLQSIKTRKTLVTFVPHPVRAMCFFVVYVKLNAVRNLRRPADAKGGKGKSKIGDDTHQYGIAMLTADASSSQVVVTKLGSSASLPAAIASSPDGSVLAALVDAQIWLWNLTNDTFHRFGHSHALTCLAFHPFEAYFTVGDKTGCLTSYFYQKRRSSAAPATVVAPSRPSAWGFNKQEQKETAPSDLSTDCPTSRLKWHAHEVLSLCFTEDGAYLLSGGHEGVLVIWQLSSGAQNFLPRFGDAISRITIGPVSSTYALALPHSNAVVLIDGPTLKIRSRIQAFQTSTQQPPIGLIAAPTAASQQVIAAGVPGVLQWYNVELGRSDRLLEVAYNSLATTNKFHRLRCCIVTHTAVSHDGAWLVTADYRSDDVAELGAPLPEVNLRFWHYDVQSANYELNTSVLGPHKNQRLSSLRFHPHDDLVVSCATRDSAFRFWTPVIRPQAVPSKVDVTSAAAVNAPLTWVCRSIGEYQENVVLRDCAFSLDGSLLAVCSEATVSLWDPYLNVLLRTLVHCAGVPAAESVRALRFLQSHGNDTPHPFLAALTSRRIVMWDLLTCQVAWECAVFFDQVAVSPDGSRLAVSTCLYTHNMFSAGARSFTWKRHGHETEKNHQHTTTTYVCLFEPDSPVPVKVMRQPTFVLGMTFLGPHTLTILTDKHEFISFSIDDDDSDDDDDNVVSGDNELLDEASSQSRRRDSESDTSVLSIFTSGEVPKSATPATLLLPATSAHVDPASKIFDTPSHLLPALSAIHSTFMAALLRPADVPAATTTAAAAASQPVVDESEQAPVSDDSFQELQQLKATQADTFDSPHYEAFVQFFADMWKDKPAAASSATTPAKEKRAATPSKAKSAATTPAKDKSAATTPAKDKSAATTPAKSSATTPAKNKSAATTPAKDKSAATTPAKSSATTPAKDKRVATPAKDKPAAASSPAAKSSSRRQSRSS